MTARLAAYACAGLLPLLLSASAQPVLQCWPDHGGWRVTLQQTEHGGVECRLHRTKAPSRFRDSAGEAVDETDVAFSISSPDYHTALHVSIPEPIAMTLGTMTLVNDGYFRDAFDSLQSDMTSVAVTPEDGLMVESVPDNNAGFLADLRRTLFKGDVLLLLPGLCVNLHMPDHDAVQAELDDCLDEFPNT